MKSEADCQPPITLF
ncbi:hypothetical protein D018_0018A, partial [Vibrio parahaemolyticus VP2007-007]